MAIVQYEITPHPEFQWDGKYEAKIAQVLLDNDKESNSHLPVEIKKEVLINPP